MLHQIGAGTLGPVYRGHDTQRERLVAVKLFKLDMPPEQVHQLAAGLERIVSAKLAHPSIATPVAAGLTGVSAYLACDYVAADSLDLAVREFGALPPADALQVAARLAGALDLAVAAGFTHGCLHPRDVLMSARETRLTGTGVGPLLAELGVAPPVRRPYSAPERLGGSAWDRRADVFSLAALIHELLWGRRISGTGVKAVEGMTALAGGDLDALKRVFKRALADDPMERHPTAKIFVDALKRALPDVAADAPGFNLPAASPPTPPARNLRLATPTRPETDDAEPRLPLELPRFADVESALPDLPITVAGPSIIEPLLDSIDAEPEDETQSALDRFSLGWLAREPAPPKSETPFELPSFFETDRNAVPDISLKPIVIPDLTAAPESATSAEPALEPTLVLRELPPEAALVTPHTPEPPDPAPVPEAVTAPAVEPVVVVESAPPHKPAAAVEPAAVVESAPPVKPAPEFKAPPAGKPASVGERNREIKPVREVKPAPAVEPVLEAKPAHEIKSAPAIEPAPEVARASAPVPAPEPSPPMHEPPRRMTRSGPRPKSTNPLIGDAPSVRAAAPVMADAAVAARRDISSRGEAVVSKKNEPAAPKREVVEEAAEALPPPPGDLTMLDRSRSAVWPLVLALAVGVTLGFAGGYAVAVRSQPATAAPTSASAAPATPSREFTEAAVPAATKPAAPPDAAASTSKPEIISRPLDPPPENVTSERITRAPEPAAVRPPNPPAAPRKADAPAAAPAPQIWTGGRLNIRSTPPGATVSVDGRDVGETPTAVRDLKEGPLRIRIRRDGYTVHDRRVVITRARPVQIVTATLARQAPPAGRSASTTARSPATPAPAAATGSGSLTVESRPTGANVVLDGKVIGTTPFTMQSVPAGLHAIRLELEGYRIWASSVRIAANEPARVRASLER